MDDVDSIYQSGYKKGFDDSLKILKISLQENIKRNFKDYNLGKSINEALGDIVSKSMLETLEYLDTIS